jgi:hypothetical protein
MGIGGAFGFGWEVAWTFQWILVGISSEFVMNF